mgnify:FL=1
MKALFSKLDYSSYHEKLVQLFSFHGFQCTLKNHINNSFAIIDEKTVWYGCSELFAASDDICVLRMMDEELLGSWL